MKIFLFAGIICCIFVGIRSSDNATYDIATTTEADMASINTVQCLMCDVIIDKNHACITKANASIGSQVSLVGCPGYCFVEKTTIVGFTLMFKRGCSASCVEDDACNGMVRSGKCMRCCESNYCNANLGLSSASAVRHSLSLAAVTAILTVILSN